jgi:hypothetical protein
MINGRPTQAPLNREQQATAFEALKRQYAVEETKVPQFPIQGIKDLKLSETEQLKALQAQMAERGLKETKVAEHIHENQQKEVVSQFYCRHVFAKVNASFFGMPVRTKVCNKCGLVK